MFCSICNIKGSLSEIANECDILQIHQQLSILTSHYMWAAVHVFATTKITVMTLWNVIMCIDVHCHIIDKMT
jgi:hypothetical protein